MQIISYANLFIYFSSQFRHTPATLDSRYRYQPFHWLSHILDNENFHFPSVPSHDWIELGQVSDWLTEKFRVPRGYRCWVPFKKNGTPNARHGAPPSNIKNSPPSGKPLYKKPEGGHLPTYPRWKVARGTRIYSAHMSVLSPLKKTGGNNIEHWNIGKTFQFNQWTWDIGKQIL